MFIIVQLQYAGDGRLPAHNTRINPPSTIKGNIYGGSYSFLRHDKIIFVFFYFIEEENAGEDNPECQTRERIKAMGEDLIGLKTKRMRKPKSKK